MGIYRRRPLTVEAVQFTGDNTDEVLSFVGPSRGRPARAGVGNDAASRLRLVPGVPTRIPGTRCEVRWDGAAVAVVGRCGGLWDLSPLVGRGRVLLWQRLADRPHLGWWPVVALASRAVYRSSGG